MMKKCIFKNVIVSAILIVMILTCTGCKKSDGEGEQKTKSNIESMQSIEQGYMQCLYEGGYHPHYELTDSQIKELEKIAKRDIEYEKTYRSDVHNVNLNIALYIFCNDGSTYQFLMGGKEVYLDVDYDDDYTQEMWKINDEELYNFMERVIKELGKTDGSAIYDWEGSFVSKGFHNEYENEEEAKEFVDKFIDASEINAVITKRYEGGEIIEDVIYYISYNESKMYVYTNKKYYPEGPIGEDLGPKNSIAIDSYYYGNAQAVKIKEFIENKDNREEYDPKKDAFVLDINGEKYNIKGYSELKNIIDEIVQYNK